MRIFHQNTSCGFNESDTPACVPQENDVARGRVDGKMLIERSDRHIFRLGHDLKDCCIGNRAPVTHRRDAAAPASLQTAVYAIPQDPCAERSA